MPVFLTTVVAPGWRASSPAEEIAHLGVGSPASPEKVACLFGRGLAFLDDHPGEQ
jgi:hypothetical protein